MKPIKTLKWRLKKAQAFLPGEPEVLFFMGNKVYHLYGNCARMPLKRQDDRAVIMLLSRAEAAGLSCCKECLKRKSLDKYYTKKISYFNDKEKDRAAYYE